jgi:chromosome partitioning protein
MSVPVIAFFNNTGGVGKTSLVYHLAWMYADLGLRVVAADLDPQSNLTAAFLDEEKIEELWRDKKTIFGALDPLKRGVGDLQHPHLENIDDRLALLPGDLRLSSFEDQLSENWPKCTDGDERAFRVTSALWRAMQRVAEEAAAHLILADLGPNLGAINRAALIASDYVVIPLASDLFSLQGLRNLGPTFRTWREQWTERLRKRPADPDLQLPSGKIQPVGYIIQQHSIRLDRPTKAYERWTNRIPTEYREHVLNEQDCAPTAEPDPHCLALLKHYRSLMALAQEARKPIFHLKSADGAIGAHFAAVQQVHQHFKSLAQAIASRASIPMPQPLLYR